MTAKKENAVPEQNGKMIKSWTDFRTQALKAAESGLLLIFGEFCQELSEIVFDSLMVAKNKNITEMKVLINSTGGKNLAFTAIKGFMGMSGIKFTGVVAGCAASNGFNILQLCQKRLAIPGSQIMFHWGSNWVPNAELDALINGETWPVENMISEETAFMKVVALRSGQSEETLKRIARQERYFEASTALEWGFIDGILAELPQNFTWPEMI